jgi:hypothetical protein
MTDVLIDIADPVTCFMADKDAPMNFCITSPWVAKGRKFYTDGVAVCAVESDEPDSDRTNRPKIWPLLKPFEDNSLFHDWNEASFDFEPCFINRPKSVIRTVQTRFSNGNSYQAFYVVNAMRLDPVQFGFDDERNLLIRCKKCLVVVRAFAPK